LKKSAIFGLSLLCLSAMAVPFLSAATYPNLIGTWSGVGKGISAESGFFDISVAMTVLEQQKNLFRGTMAVGPPGGEDGAMLFTGIILPDKEIDITIGYDPSEKKPVFVRIRGKLTARTMSAFWQNLENGETGYIVLKNK
jgi:hypothetical protein